MSASTQYVAFICTYWHHSLVSLVNKGLKYISVHRYQAVSAGLNGNSKKIFCSLRLRSHHHRISPCIINLPIRGLSALFPVVVSDEYRTKACMADEKSMSLCVSGQGERKFSCFVVDHFVIFIPEMRNFHSRKNRFSFQINFHLIDFPSF